MGRYIKASQMAALLGLDSSTAPEILDFFIEAAEAAIDRETGRSFDSVTETRRFDVVDPSDYLSVGDLVSVTTFKIADQTGADYTTLTADDYFLGPSVRSSGDPYRWISLSDVGSYVYSEGHRTVEIAGVWGWPAVPADIKQIAMAMAVRNYQQSRGGGVSRITDIPDLGTIEFTDPTTNVTGGFTASEKRTLAGRSVLVIA